MTDRSPEPAGGAPADGPEARSTPLLMAAAPGEGALVLRISGELDLGTAADLTAKIDALVAGGANRLVVDLGALAFCDSTGLTAFVRGDRRCRGAGGWLRLTNARGHVARVIELSGVGDVLGYRPEV